MATGIGVNQGKTAFLEEFLPGNRDATLTEINEAWRAGGHEGTVSKSLIGKTRSRLELTGTSRNRGRAARGTSVPPSRGRRTPKARETPSRPGGRRGGNGAGKSAFIREQLGRDDTLGAGAINRAWSAAGHEGEITDNLVYKARATLGIKGRRAPSAGRPAVAAAPESSPGGAGPAGPAFEPPAPRSNGRHAEPPPGKRTESSADAGPGRELHEIEGEIDELMFRLRGLGGYAGVIEALRAARRLLVRSHGE